MYYCAFFLFVNSDEDVIVEYSEPFSTNLKISVFIFFNIFLFNFVRIRCVKSYPFNNRNKHSKIIVMMFGHDMVKVHDTKLCGGIQKHKQTLNPSFAFRSRRDPFGTSSRLRMVNKKDTSRS